MNKISLSKYRTQRTSRRPTEPEMNFNLWRFIKRYFLPIAAIIVCVVLVKQLQEISKDQKTKIRESNSEIDYLYEENETIWKLRYPLGYKIIAITSEGIEKTHYDVLDKNLKLRWSDVRVSIVRDAMRGPEERINIRIPSVTYKPSNINNLSIKTAVARRVGAKIILVKMKDCDLVLEVLQDNGGKIFCIVGLKYT